MLTATLRLFSEESGSSDYSPKTGETIAEIRRSGQYNGEEQQQGTSYKARRLAACPSRFCRSRWGRDANPGSKALSPQRSQSSPRKEGFTL